MSCIPAPLRCFPVLPAPAVTTGMCHWCAGLCWLRSGDGALDSFPFTVCINRCVTVYFNTAGCSEPLGMKSRLISDQQITASSVFKTWGIDAFTWYPHYARLDKMGKTNAWTALHNDQSEWLQVGKGWQGSWHTSVHPSPTPPLCFAARIGSVLLFPGWNGNK